MIHENFKKAISFEGANQLIQDFLGQQSEISKAAAKGIAGDKIPEPVPVNAIRKYNDK